MAYKIAIDANAGGSDYGSTGNNINEKDYTLLISKYINNRLTALGIDNFLVRDKDETLTTNERVNEIKNKYGTGNNVIVISNRLNNTGEGAEVIYALRNNSKLASSVANGLENVGVTVNKYYQLRDNDNTELDEDLLIRNTANNQTIIIDYGSVNNDDDAYKIKNNYEDIAEGVIKAIADYSNVTYYPVDEDNYYIVKKGDSLWAIASKFGTTVDKLKKMNNLTSNILTIGQLIKIKDNTIEENTNKISYTVKKGDSLWAIANKYDTTVDQIKSANNLNSNNLSIGQILIIPSTTNYITYIVVKGDSLWAIAKKYNTTVDNIKKLNNLSSNNLSIGQKLLITA